MTGLRETFKQEHGERTRGFSLSADLSSSAFNQRATPKRPSYKASLDAAGHVKFTNGNTHVIVTNENASGSRKEKEHHLPVQAIARYSSMVAEGKLSGINEQEKQNAAILAKAVAPHVKPAPTGMKLH